MCCPTCRPWPKRGCPTFGSLAGPLFVKAGTPEPVVATLQKAFNSYFQSPDYKAYVGRTGGYYTAMSTPEMVSFITTEIERSKAALQRAGIQPE